MYTAQIRSQANFFCGVRTDAGHRYYAAAFAWASVLLKKIYKKYLHRMIVLISAFSILIIHNIDM